MRIVVVGGESEQREGWRGFEKTTLFKLSYKELSRDNFTKYFRLTAVFTLDSGEARRKIDRELQFLIYMGWFLHFACKLGPWFIL